MYVFVKSKIGSAEISFKLTMCMYVFVTAKIGLRNVLFRQAWYIKANPIIFIYVDGQFIFNIDAGMTFTSFRDSQCIRETRTYKPVVTQILLTMFI